MAAGGICSIPGHWCWAAVAARARPRPASNQIGKCKYFQFVTNSWIIETGRRNDHCRWCLECLWLVNAAKYLPSSTPAPAAVVALPRMDSVWTKYFYSTLYQLRIFTRPLRTWAIEISLKSYFFILFGNSFNMLKVMCLFIDYISSIYDSLNWNMNTGLYLLYRSIACLVFIPNMGL